MISRSLVPSMPRRRVRESGWRKVRLEKTNRQTDRQADRRGVDAKLRFRSYIASRHEEHIAIPLACEPLESSGSRGPRKKTEEKRDI